MAFIEVIDDKLFHLDNNETVIVVYLDLQKAFEYCKP